MKIRVTKNARNNDATAVEVKRADLTELQKRAYKFAEKMMEKGTVSLRIDARSRLAANDLSFSDIYHELGIS